MRYLDETESEVGGGGREETSAESKYGTRSSYNGSAIMGVSGLKPEPLRLPTKRAAKENWAPMVKRVYARRWAEELRSRRRMEVDRSGGDGG